MNQLPTEVQKNMEMVAKMKEQATANQVANTIMQGNKALIPVTIDYVADSGNEYHGVITFRRPSTMDYMRMGAQKSEMLRLLGIQPQFVQAPNGQFVESMAHVDQTIMSLATAVSTMRVIMADCPEWFKKFEELEDPDLILYVYNKYDEALYSFRRSSANPPAEGQSAGSNTGTMEGTEAIRGESLPE